MYKRILIVFSSLFILLGLLTSPWFPYAIRINSSFSLPHYAFWGIKEKPTQLHKGQIVAFSHSISSIVLIKEVAGLPGDMIRVKNQHIYINDKDIGEIKKDSPSGSKLTPIREGIIEKGKIFVRGWHEQSFDSRYEEIGLIEVSSIKELLWPIF
jgi:conjugal transfer pilin signal peptidase TrbI